MVIQLFCAIIVADIPPSLRSDGVVSSLICNYRGTLPGSFRIFQKWSQADRVSRTRLYSFLPTETFGRISIRTDGNNSGFGGELNSIVYHVLYRLLNFSFVYFYR